MYYPKSQIKTDLFTNGDEFYVEGDKLKKSYIGPYYKTSKGENFIGEKPSRGNRKLLPLNPEVNQSPPPPSLSRMSTTLDMTAYSPAPYSSNYNVQEYNKIYDNFTPRSIPKPIPSTPTPDEITQGVYTRYFAKKNNELIFMEIGKDTYLLFKSNDPSIASDLYEVVSFSYQTGGPGSNGYAINSNQILQIEKRNNWKGFNIWCTIQGIGGTESPPIFTKFNTTSPNSKTPKKSIGGSFSKGKYKIVIDPMENPQKISTPQNQLWDIKPNRPTKNNY